MYICKHCNKEYRSQKAVTGHECRCKENPIRILQWNEGKTGLQQAWNKGLPGVFIGKTHTEASKKKISVKMNGNRNANHRGDRQSYYNNIRMDSRWEVGTAKYFDDHNISWKYSERGFRLSNGKYYYPDFFIYEDNKFIKLIEVKGYFREQNRLKFDMFLKEYPDIKIELWQQNKLFELGIITKSGNVTGSVGEWLKPGDCKSPL